MPPAASGPVLTVNRPIFIGAFWAFAGIGSDAVAAAAAVPARNLRRFIYGIAFSPISHGCRNFAPNERPRATAGHLSALAQPGTFERKLERLALKPGRALGIERIELRPIMAGHVGLDLVADAALQIGEMAIALWELCQEVLVEREFGGRIDRIESVLFICEAAQHDAPFAFAFFKKIVEAAGAHYVA